MHGISAGLFKAMLLCAVSALSAAAADLNDAWIKGTTCKNPLSYKAGEDIAITLELMGVKGGLSKGEYSLSWKLTDDCGRVEKGTAAVDGKPFVCRTSLAEPGFVRLQAWVVCKDGSRYRKKYTGDTSTPEGRKAMNRFEKRGCFVSFDGGAGVDVDKLTHVSEPADFDAFWARQFARLEKVPVKADRIDVTPDGAPVRIYAVRVDCAGLRPVTGYLTVPKTSDSGARFPCRLLTHGYGNNYRQRKPRNYVTNEIIFNVNAHGYKLSEFGATEADIKAFAWEIDTNGRQYAFDSARNKDPETAYFNGMVLRVKRALQYLKTLECWNGTDLIASGSSQGGLQTIWAAGCGEGVTKAESSVTWCCDMQTNERRLAGKISSDGWYIPWCDAMGYYDAVNFAKRIPVSCRTEIIRAGLGDYCCPPMGLAKLWNAIPGGNKKVLWVQGSKHGYVPPSYEGRDTVWDRSVK